MSDVEKLPKWAREHIRRLESRVETLQSIIATRNGEAVGGHITINHYDDDGRLVFPDHTSVRFALSDTGWRDYFEVRLKGTGIEVACGGPMTIKPHVTNVISLMPESS
jgi:hypothetical protein